MTEHRDEIGSQDDAPVKLDRSDLVGPDAPKLITAAAVGAAVGAAVTHVLQSMQFMQEARSGDEAPIRVKGGSITFEALSKTAKWEQIGTNRDHWVLTEGERGRDEYLVVLVIKDSSGNLESHTLCGKNKILLHYGENAVVELKSNSSTGKRKTHLKSTHGANSDTSVPPVLTYLQSIRRIVVGSSSFDLLSGSTLESMLLLDC
jgi:hypothetical protein